ncbi:MAG: transposase [Saprospiraceae bacterium]|nr:transposase [Saprospiraceae bacterium]
MQLIENHIFHVYNRGNNKQPIFFKPDNYLFFLKKIRKHLLPVCEILAYCLMPNHFHLLIQADSRSVALANPENTRMPTQKFSRGLQTLLSSYSKAIQIQEKLTGSLFQQRTKAKQVSSEWSWEDYSLICFRYILHNPVAAGLVNSPDDWEYSSCRDFAGIRSGTLCNQNLVYKTLNLEWNTLEGLVNQPLTEQESLRIF